MKRSLLIGALLMSCAFAHSADIFRFSAPPGGAYANVAFERAAEVMVTLTIEHDGVGIPAWFVAIDAGGAGVYEPREMSKASDLIEYQLYGEPTPSSKVIKAPPEILGVDNVLTGPDFGSAVGTPETGAVSFYLAVPAGQFQPSGEYTDSVTVSLYEGDYATPGTHVLADSVSLSITGRNAELLDIFADREPGIRSMDLASSASAHLIATINERSNSATGYTVSLTSANLAADTGGASSPYFTHTSASGTLDYSLTYDGVAVSPWTSGTAIVTDSVATTAPEWLLKELRISYSGSALLPAGDYEDVLTVTISAK